VVRLPRDLLLQSEDGLGVADDQRRLLEPAATSLTVQPLALCIALRQRQCGRHGEGHDHEDA
jgi:hypothetical protein